MIQKTGILLLLQLLVLFANAQQQISKQTQLLEVTAGIGNEQGTASVAYVYNWHIGQAKRFSIGTGLRFSSYFGANKYFITAPAKLTSGSTGPLVIFKENITANIDSLLFDAANTNALNITINMAYAITPKLTAGVNIDAVGFSFGKEQFARYVNGTTVINTTAKPTALNALLVSDNDYGTLNSEFFAAYQLRGRWSIKAGIGFLFSEYRTATNVQQLPEPNDRFRNKVTTFAVGVRYKL